MGSRVRGEARINKHRDNLSILKDEEEDGGNDQKMYIFCPKLFGLSSHDSFKLSSQVSCGVVFQQSCMRSRV